METENQTADYDALADEVVDLVLAHQGQGIGGPHGAVREAIMRVFPPGAETDQSDTEQHTTSVLPPGLLDDYDPVPGLVARGVMSDEHDPDSCEAACCIPPAKG